MYSLSNADLLIEVLDPIADQERFGVRYCTGGYIFQVTDAYHGPLLTGPTYPESFNWFDGQGLPEAFNLGPILAPGDSSTALIMGIGICNLQDRTVQEFCSWQVEKSEQAIRMATTQIFHDTALSLVRTVSLHARTLRSATTLKNTGNRPLPLCWFPHPFFPQPETDELCRLNIPVSMPDNAGYSLAENGFIVRKEGWNVQHGHYQALDHAAHTNLVIMQRHPKLGIIGATCSYVPTFFPIWGNQRTFSWEPFFERTVAPGQELSWSIDYDF